MALSTACTAPIGSDQFLLGKNLDQYGRFGRAAHQFGSLKIDLIVDFTAQDAKWFPACELT